MNENENKMEETTEVRPVDDFTNETSKGSSTLAKLVIVGAVGAVTGAAVFGLKKLRARNEKKTIERLKKAGWKIEEPVSEDDDEFVDGEWEEVDSDEEKAEE